VFQYFIDFEASGLAPDSYPIEVAVVGPNVEYSTLIAPVRYWEHWSFDAQDMHGLSREMLFANGAAVEDVATQLNSVFSGKILWSDSNFDVLWMEVLFEAAGFEPTFEVKNFIHHLSNQQVKDFLRTTTTACFHRALPDAMKNRAVVEQIIK
jgi:hypothetical protein